LVYSPFRVVILDFPVSRLLFHRFPVRALRRFPSVFLYPFFPSPAAIQTQSDFIGFPPPPNGSHLVRSAFWQLIPPSRLATLLRFLVFSFSSPSFNALLFLDIAYPRSRALRLSPCGCVASYLRRFRLSATPHWFFLRHILRQPPLASSLVRQRLFPCSPLIDLVLPISIVFPPYFFLRVNDRLFSSMPIFRPPPRNSCAAQPLAG